MMRLRDFDAATFEPVERWTFVDTTGESHDRVADVLLALEARFAMEGDHWRAGFVALAQGRSLIVIAQTRIAEADERRQAEEDARRDAAAGAVH